MTVKQFFKSTAFKCIVTLLCVLLVSGIFLTIMNGLLEVTEEEKFQRVLSEIYGKSVSTTKQDISDKNTNLSTAVINDVYKVEDGNYIVNVSGKNGYGGNVLCWVVILPKADGKSVGGVGNVRVPSADNSAETFLNNISASMLEKFSKDYADGIVYSYGKDENDKNGEMYVKTDASYSMRGICNAVNGTIQFMNAYLSGTDVAVEDPYEAFAYHEYINMEETSWTKADGEITYSITTKGKAPAGSFKIDVVVDSAKTIKSFTVVKSGSDPASFDNKMYENIAGIENKGLSYFTDLFGEDMAFPGENSGKFVSSGASYSSYLCMYAGAFAIANYDYISSLKVYTEYIDLEETTATVEGDEVHYSITTKGKAPAGSFKIDVVVDATKTIKSFTVVKSGSDPASFDNKMNENIAGIENKGLSYFTDLFGEDMAFPGENSGKFVSSGASYSSYLCMYAGAFAVANYSDYLTQNDGGAGNE